jgi:pimeloyl-ACP methyl ester carboxylesterase
MRDKIMPKPAPASRWLFCSLLLLTCIATAQPAGQPFPVNVTPLLVDEPNPVLSFWRDQVHYPFPVRYAKAVDSRRVEWEIAYMDEYAGPAGQKSKARTLVLIHGRGANAGTWAQLMSAALRAGMRVIALDIPHYGKSIPGNLDKPLMRSLDDVREIFHAIIVDQLQVKKAVYLGHSLGGQLVFGYALRYPQAVERIVAVSSGGLEEFNPSGLYNPAMERNQEMWEKAWEGTTLLAREFARQPHVIEADYYFQGDGRSPGYFLRDGTVPRFITDARKKMIAGNEKEYRNYITSYVHEIYTVGVELLSNDPQNLNRRLDGLKMPVFLVMGGRDPFFPATLATGNSDLRLDLLKPFHDRLKAKGNPPQIKVYQGAGHFIHTDLPEMLAQDVLAFIDGKQVPGTENVAAYETSILHDLGLRKQLTNFWQELVLDCLSRT